VDVTPLPDGEGWRVGDTTFVFDYGRDSTADRFLIRKPPDLFEMHVDLATRFQHANIVELGIAAGGGTALLSLLAKPKVLIACELDPVPVAALHELIDACGLGPVVRPFYGVDQADRERLAEIVDGALAGEPLDLVIDDASHRYDETLASFEVLFPRLRPGGRFIIEDWAADYAYAQRIEATLSGPPPAAEALRQRLDEMAAGRAAPPRPLPRIGIELLQVCGGTQDLVGELTINRHWIAVERGSAPLDPATFRLREHCPDPWGWLAD
jgi:predicted O-methyltransferase YrrM